MMFVRRLVVGHFRDWFLLSCGNCTSVRAWLRDPSRSANASGISCGAGIVHDLNLASRQVDVSIRPA